MNAGIPRTGWLLAALSAALVAAGCTSPAPQPAAERVSLSIYLPCVISGPMRKVITGYQQAHPEVEIWDEKEKPQALVTAASGEHSRPAVVITLGDKEMAALVESGVVAADQVRDIAANTYPLAVIVPAKGADHIQRLEDLARPDVKRVFVEDPATSTLGDRARRALQRMGLWEAVSRKLVAFDPDANVLDELLSGKAEAAVVFKDCLLEAGRPPKTIRLVGELPCDYYQPIAYQAGVIATAPRPEVARAFVEYLVSAGGREALQRAGLTPPRER